MTAAVRPGFRFKEGKLLVFTETEVMMIQSWPELSATKTKIGEKLWIPFIPVFRLLRPTRQLTRSLVSASVAPRLGPGHGQTSASEREVERYTAFRAFRFSIPPEIVKATERFPSRQWSVLRLCQASEPMRELMTANPALGFCLANLRAFCYFRQSPVELAGVIAKTRQRDLLGRMGFPRTESCVHTFAKILPEVIHLEAALRLRDALQDDEMRQLLSHVPQINAGVLALTTNPCFHDYITPKLLHEVAALSTEEGRSEVAGLLHDLQVMWTVVKPGCSSPRFQSVAKVRQTYAEVSREYCRKLTEAALACKFPKPPLPGTEDIVALTTPEQLQEEGALQSNCVSSYAKRVEGGYEYVYRVLRPERATLAVEKGSDGNWAIRQLKATQNAPVAAATWTAVENWLKKYSVSV